MAASTRCAVLTCSARTLSTPFATCSATAVSSWSRGSRNRSWSRADGRGIQSRTVTEVVSMPIAVSHGGENVYASDARSDKLLVGTRNGVVLLERSTSGWQVKDRALQGLHISAIALDAESGTVLAGAFFNGVYVSTDAGVTWQRCDDGLTYQDVFSVATKKLPNGKLRLYAGTEPAN